MEGWPTVLGACKVVAGYFKVVVGYGWRCMQKLHVASPVVGLSYLGFKLQGRGDEGRELGYFSATIKVVSEGVVAAISCF